MNPRRRLGLLCAAVVAAATACASQERLGVGTMSILGEGVINDPKNKKLRFDLLEYGLGQFCTEMRVRGAPLKVRDGEPVVGRFFADGCSAQVIDEDERQTFVVQFSGRGYAWTNVTGRLGFTAAGLIEYAPDFKLSDGRMWIYFRPTNVDATRFSVSLVESAMAQSGIALSGVNPEALGRSIVDGQLKRGFTVIRHSSRGETEFGMGFIPVGQHPFRPFRVESEEKITLDNDRTEVHAGQQEFIGGFPVTDDDQALYLTMTVDGAPSIDVLVLPKDAGDRVLTDYLQRPGPGTLSQAPLLDDTVQSGGRFERVVPLPRGSYYLMLDQTPSVGRSAPPSVAGDDRAARVDYVVQLGDAP